LLSKTAAACVEDTEQGAVTLNGASAKLGGDPAEAIPKKIPKFSIQNRIILLTRAKRGRLNQKAAEPTLSRVAFLK